MKENLPSPDLLPRRGFSLIELLLSITVLSVLLLMVMSLLEATQRTWSTAKTRVTQFRDARVAFESITRNLSQATLNTYLDFYTAAGQRIDPVYESNFDSNNRRIEPDHYDRHSELHFLVDYAQNLIGDAVPTTTHALFFQAPLGEASTEDYRILGNLLNSRGYFIAYTSDEFQRPAFLDDLAEPKYRYRLMEYRPPAERNRIYDNPEDFTFNEPLLQANDWFGDNFEEIVRNSRVIADNVIALIVSPLNSADIDNNKRFDIAPTYKYDSQPGPDTNPGTLDLKDRQRHQLPPLVRVTIVAMDEESAIRMQLDDSDPTAKFFPSGILFEDAAQFDEDLKELESFLAKTGEYAERDGAAVNFRVFSGTVSIRGAKWSDENLRIAVP